MVISVLNILTISCNGGEKISPTLENDGGNSKWDECEDSTLKLDGGFYCPLFFDDFEDNNYQEWSRGPGTYTRGVTSTYAANGTKYSFYLKGGSGNPVDGVYRSINNLKPDRIEFYVRSLSNTRADGYFVIGQNRNKIGVFFYMNDNSEMGIYDGNNWHGRRYYSRRWYKVELYINWESKTVNYYVDNIWVKTNIPFRSNSVEYFAIIYLYNFNYSEAWWDEIVFR